MFRKNILTPKFKIMDGHKNTSSSSPKPLGPPKVIGKIVVVKADGDQYSFSVRIIIDVEELKLLPPVVELTNWRQGSISYDQPAICFDPGLGGPNDDNRLLSCGFQIFMIQTIDKVPLMGGGIFQVDVKINGEYSDLGVDTEYYSIDRLIPVTCP